MCFRRRIEALLLAALGLTAGAAVAEEATCDSLITTVPYTITAAGHYCLANDITTSMTTGNAITIDAPSVVLDLRGYKLGGAAAGIGTQAYGIALLNRNNVVVRNGRVQGFLGGIQLAGWDPNTNYNNVVEQIYANANTAFGVWVGPGQYNTVRDCTITGTGGSTAPGASGWGSGGISLGSATSFAINNVVAGTTTTAGGTSDYGIYVAADGRAVGNQVIGDGNTGNATNYCLVFDPGAIYRDNVASRCGTPYGGSGTAVGTTNYP